MKTFNQSDDRLTLLIREQEKNMMPPYIPDRETPSLPSVPAIFGQFREQKPQPEFSLLHFDNRNP